MIDKRMLHDTVRISKKQELDKWGKESYSNPVTLTPVKFDRNIQVTGSGNNSKTELKASVLFIYPKFCPFVIDDSYLNGKINDGERDYTIRKIIPQYHPFKHEILCYEVEVV